MFLKYVEYNDDNHRPKNGLINMDDVILIAPNSTGKYIAILKNKHRTYTLTYTGTLQDLEKLLNSGKS